MTPFFWNGKVILILGGTGYLGNKFCETLTEFPEATILSQSKRQQAWQPLPNKTIIAGDFFDLNWLDILNCWQPDIIFHCLGTNPDAPEAALKACHLRSTRLLFEALHQYSGPTNKKPLTVFIGSASEYGLLYPENAAKITAISELQDCNPQRSYGKIKREQTKAVQTLSKQYGIPVVIFRLFNIYGQSPPGLSIARFTQSLVALKNQEPKNGSIPQLDVMNLNSVRDFIYCDDATRLMLGACEAIVEQQLATKHPGDIYNIGSGTGTALGSVLEGLCGLLGFDWQWRSPLKKQHSTIQFPAIQSFPTGLIKLPGKQRPLYVQSTGNQDLNASVADVSKLNSIVPKFELTPLMTGLEKEVAFWRQHVEETAHLV
ncbi:MAG: NAD-dependent epimerase/dehydratase [Cyanobacteria bacterium P01_H01_bin.74]